jgi:hypothetical protein
MSANFAYPTKRRFPPPEESQLRPAVGPDIQPAPIESRWLDMEDHKDSGMGPLFGVGLGKLFASGGLGSKGGSEIESNGKFLGPFGRGGVLRRAGDTAVVGDEGPELAVREADGKTRIFPFDQNGTLAAATGPQTQPPPQAAALIAAAQGQNQPIRPEDSNVLAAATSPVPPIPLLTRPPSEFQSISAPMAGHPKSRNMPTPDEEEENDARVRSVIDNAGGFAEMGGSDVRPKFADPTGRLQNQIQYERDNPAHAEQGRSIWRKLRDVGESTLIGMGSAPQGSSLGERLGYGLGVGGVQAVNPDMLPQFRQKQRVAKWGGELAAAQEQDEARIERAGKVAAVNKTVAETQEVLGRPEREAAKVRFGAQKEERVRAEVERHNRELEKYQGTSQEDSRKRAEETTRHNRRMEEIGRMTAEATAGRFDTERADRFDRETYDDSVKQIDRDNQSAKERYAAAQKAVGELRAAIKAGQAAAAKVNNPHGIWNAQTKEFYNADPADIARYREEYEKANQLVNTLGSSIRQNYGEFVDDDPDMKLPILLKPEPAPKSYPQRQPPAKRTGGPMSKYTEADVRQRAQKAGKDPDAAVKAARDSGLIN